MSNQLANKQYLAVKPQVAATTPIVPTIFLPFISESVRVNPNFSANRSIKGNNWKSDDLLFAGRQVEGDIEVWADPDTLAHLLNMTMTKGSTTGNGTDGFTHPFTVGDGDSYTVDISRGGYVHRFWGVRGDSLKFAFEDNKLKATLGIKALGFFNGASLSLAASGAVTTLKLSNAQDPLPNKGLVIGDVVTIIQDSGTAVDVTLTSVNADGITIGFSSTSITAAIGQPVFLKAQSPSFGTFQDPFYMSSALVGFGATTSAADTAAAARSTATPCYEISFEAKNNMFDAPASGYRGAAVLLNGMQEGQLELTRLFSDPTQMQKWNEAAKQAVTIICTGRFIKSDLTTVEKLTIKMNRVKLMSNEEPLEVDNYIVDKEKFEVLYDPSDAAAVVITLIDRTDGATL